MINKKFSDWGLFYFFEIMRTPLYSTKKSDFFALLKIFNILKVGLYIYDLDHDTTNS